MEIELKKFEELDRWIFRTYCTKQIGKKAYPLIKEKLGELFPKCFNEDGNFREELKSNDFAILGADE